MAEEVVAAVVVVVVVAAAAEVVVVVVVVVVAAAVPVILELEVEAGALGEQSVHWQSVEMTGENSGLKPELTARLRFRNPLPQA